MATIDGTWNTSLGVCEKTIQLLSVRVFYSGIMIQWAVRVGQLVKTSRFDHVQGWYKSCLFHLIGFRIFLFVSSSRRWFYSFLYMASSVRRQDEPNPMIGYPSSHDGLSWILFLLPCKNTNPSTATLVWSRRLILLYSFWMFMDLDFISVKKKNMPKIVLGKHPATLTGHARSITHICTRTLAVCFLLKSWWELQNISDKIDCW